MQRVGWQITDVMLMLFFYDFGTNTTQVMSVLFKEVKKKRYMLKKT